MHSRFKVRTFHICKDWVAAGLVTDFSKTAKKKTENKENKIEKQKKRNAREGKLIIFPFLAAHATKLKIKSEFSSRDSQTGTKVDKTAEDNPR